MKKFLKCLWLSALLITTWITNITNWGSFQLDASWYVYDYNVVWTTSTDVNWDDRLITTIKNAINRVLWILWLIALILCLRWWFQMLTAAGDDWKVKTWTKILKNAAIWLIVIWISWLVVTLIFRIINSVAAT